MIMIHVVVVMMMMMMMMMIILMLIMTNSLSRYFLQRLEALSANVIRNGNSCNYVDDVIKHIINK